MKPRDAKTSSTYPRQPPLSADSPASAPAAAGDFHVGAQSADEAFVLAELSAFGNRLYEAQQELDDARSALAQDAGLL